MVSGMALSVPRFRVTLLAVLLLLLASAVAVLPSVASRPLLAWFPAESRLGGTMLRATAAVPDLRLIEIHRPNAIVMVSDDPWFPVRLLAEGGIPVPMPLADVVCRAPR
jgi:hypothetical protein